MRFANCSTASPPDRIQMSALARRIRGIGPWGLALSGIILAGLGLRLWGITYGLPFGYQIDEERTYTRIAVQMLKNGSIDPHYFHNPPLYAYLLSVVFAVSHGARDAAATMGSVPGRGDLFLIARIICALIGTLGIWMLAMVTRRFFGRETALIAAALLAVAFLPVFYSHVALNNVPAMTAGILALIGAAGILHRGRTRDFVVAGIGAGIAAGTKYTVGIMILPVLTAALFSPQGREVVRRIRGVAISRRLQGAAISCFCAAASFVAVNPYMALAPDRVIHAMGTQGRVVGETKHGQDPNGGLLFYTESWTWTVGWIPALAAVAGAVLLFRRDRRAAWILVPVVPIFIVYMGWQTRYFGRWMLPVLPVVLILAAYAGWQLVEEVRRRRPRFAAAGTALVVAALVAQSLIHVIHNDRVLSRPHTLNLAREWMVENIPKDSGVMAEPIRAPSWHSPWERGRTSLQTPYDSRAYAVYLDRGLVDEYREAGYCWVVASSNYWGLVLNDEQQSDDARAYYETLAREGELVFEASPWGPVDSHGYIDDDVVEFNYDFAYDFYPLAYDRPGPRVHVYRLRGGKCGR